MPGDAGQLVFLRNGSQRGAFGRTDLSAAAYVDIEAGVAGCDLNIERLAALDGAGNCPGSLDRARHGRRQDRAMVDRHDLVAARGSKSNFEHVMTATARMEHDAAAA